MGSHNNADEKRFSIGWVNGVAVAVAGLALLTILVLRQETSPARIGAAFGTFLGFVLFPYVLGWVTWKISKHNLKTARNVFSGVILLCFIGFFGRGIGILGSLNQDTAERQKWSGVLLAIQEKYKNGRAEVVGGFLKKHAAFVAPEVVNLSNLDWAADPQEIQRQIGIVQGYVDAADGAVRFFANTMEFLTFEMQNAGVPAATQKEFWQDYDEAKETCGKQMDVFEAHRSCGQNVLKLLEFFQSNNGRFTLDKVDGRLLFENQELVDSFNEIVQDMGDAEERVNLAADKWNSQL